MDPIDSYDTSYFNLPGQYVFEEFISHKKNNFFNKNFFNKSVTYDFDSDKLKYEVI